MRRVPAPGWRTSRQQPHRAGPWRTGAGAEETRNMTAANALPLSLRFRQVHLDFHTSPLIPDVGRDFDAEAFADSVQAGHIDSITCFAKCHHGMSYYPTKV